MGAKKTEEAAARITGLVAIPCAIGLAVLARPITALLGFYSGEKLELATRLMSILGICVFFNAVVLVSTAIMQAHGNEIRPVVNMVAAGCIRLLAVYVLTGNPLIGIVGAPISNLCCYVLIFLLNLLTIRSLYKEAPAILPNVLRPLLSGLIMGACAYLSYRGLALLTGSRLVLCALPVAVGGVVYVAAVVLLKVITKEDCLLLPKGEKIAKILRL